MNFRPRHAASQVPARKSPARPGRSRLVPLAVLLLASALLGGCIIDPGGHGSHHGWGWWHHDDR